MVNKFKSIAFIVFPLLVLVGIQNYQFIDNFSAFAEEYPSGSEIPPYEEPMTSVSTPSSTEESTSAESTPSSGDDSIPTSTETSIPLPPLGVKGVVVSSGTGAKIQWQDVSANEAVFQVHRRLEGAAWAKIAVTLSDRTEYYDLGVPKGKYEYRVHACNNKGCSIGIDIAKVTILDGTAALVPLQSNSIGDINFTNVRIENIFGRGAQVKWVTDIPSDSFVQYATSSALLRQSSADRCDVGGFVVFHCVNLTNLTYNTTYFIRAKSVGSNGVSSVSALHSFTTPATQFYNEEFGRQIYKMTDVQQSEYNDSLEQISNDAYKLQRSILKLQADENKFLLEQTADANVIQHSDASSTARGENEEFAQEHIDEKVPPKLINRNFRLKQRERDTLFTDNSKYIAFQDYKRKIIEQSTPDDVRNDSLVQARQILQEISATEEELPDSIEDPRQAKEEVLPEVFKVGDVRSKEPIEVIDPTFSEDQIIVLSGVGPPNSVVVLYIFSTPVIVTVRTDANGSWEYNLNRELEDGKHEVHVASVDNSGKILAKSEPFIFFKNTSVAQAAEISFDAPPLPIQVEPQQSFWRENFLWVSFIIISVLVFATIILMGFLLRKEDK